MLTLELMERLFPTKGLNPRKFNLVRERKLLVEAMNSILPKYGINNFKRLCAFLANCGIETDYFRTTEEYASGWDYDISVNPQKARELGNFHKGDGPKFKGGGLSQTTGGNNYEDLNPIIGKKLGIDFTKNPEKLREDISIAVESACIYWDLNNLNSYADRGEFRYLSGIVNRGDKDKLPLHWAKRNELYSKCKRVIPNDFSISVTSPTKQEIEPIEPVMDNSDNANLPATSPNDIKPDATINPGNSNTSADFLSDAFDRNVSSEQVKTASLSFGSKLWRRVVRPLGLLYTALEAGNIYAWFGVSLAVIFAVYLIYAHRQDIRNLWQKLTVKLTNKFTS